MDADTIMLEIKKYIGANIIAGDVVLDADTELQDAGIDSFSIVEIILFIERIYGVPIPDEKLVPENFRSLRALATMVQELKQPG